MCDMREKSSEIQKKIFPNPRKYKKQRMIVKYNLKYNPITALSNVLQIKCIPSGHLLAQSKNRSTRTRCELCSKITIKTPEQLHWRRSGVFIVNFEHISHLVLVFLLLTLTR